ncbi:MAG: alpha/beta hydrolase [Phycisphaeraceae bacterium]|nr:MAG: alpha/beta hydrolase [Phycisphaeraceae bacterium]
MQTERVRFPGGAGHEIAALLDLPEGDPRAFAIFAHCFTCSKNLKVVGHVASQLAAEGIGVLRFDFTGLGQSEGEFAETTFTTNIKDLVAAAEYLEREREAPRVLIGHSLGGAAVIHAAHKIESVRCVATIGAPSDPTNVRQHLIGADFDELGVAEVSIGGRPFRIGKDFVEDLERHDTADRIANLGRPIMIFHSPVDRIVGIEHAERIFKAARHPRSFVSLGEADHLVGDERDARFLGHVLSAWAGRYVDA